MLANRAWVDTSAMGDFRILDVAESEPFAANVVVIAGVVLMPSGFPRTCEAVARAGWNVQTVDISELMKGEAGLTCMSLLFNA
jgi:dimethylargininase